MSSSHPRKKSGSNSYVSNLINHMKEKNKIELFWVVCESSRITKSRENSEKIYDIREFSDAKDILDKIKPDAVLAINNKFDPIQCGISIASKFEKIPLIHFKVIEKVEEKFSSNIKIQKISKNFQILLNSDTNSDSKKILNRISFILYKHNFLNKTRSKLGIKIFKNIRLFFNEMISYFQEKQRMHIIADLQLVNNQDWMKYFKKIGFNENKLALTGSPNWDPIYEKIANRNLEEINVNGKQIRILIITCPLVEHGYGTYSQRNSFLKNIFNELASEKIDLEIKIHPSSEMESSYQEFLEKNDLKIPIFQKEKLWDIIENYDIVLTYGYGYPQIECAFGGIRTILLKTEWNFPIIPIVNAAINSGYFRICGNLKDIIPTIHELLNKKIEINNEILSERENISYKFDGRAGERAVQSILDLLKNF